MTTESARPADQHRNLGLAGAAAVCIGSLGPWATNGLTSMSGTSADGAITLGVGAVAAALIWIDRWAFAVTVLGILTAIGCTVTAIQAEDLFASPVGDISPAWGLYVAIAGGAIVTAYGWRRITPG